MKPTLVVLLLAVCTMANASAQTTAVAAPPDANRAAPVADVATISDAAGASLSFAEALDLLSTNNHVLRAAQREEERRQEEQKVARGLRWPRLDIEAFVTAINEPIVMDLDPIRDVILTLHPEVPPQLVPPFESTILDDQFFRALLSLNWPVYTGGKIKAANAAAAAEVEIARQERSQTEHELVGGLVQRYFALRLAEAARDVHRQVLVGADRHLWEAVRLEEEGMVARTERLHAEVTRAEAARALASSEHDVQLATTALATILESPQYFSATSNLFIHHRLPSLEYFVEQADQLNPILGQLDAQTELAHQGLEVARSGYLPDVFVFGAHQLYTEDLSFLEPKWAVGVGAKVTLFDGFSRRHRINAARMLEDRVANLGAAARSDIALLTEKHYHELEKALEQYDTLEATRTLAEENLRVRTSAFEEGFGTSMEVVDARNILARVRLARLAAAYDFDVALADLLTTAGASHRFAEFLSDADVEVE
ncbi:MAG: TolC family protein [Acidobacteriota bacterium]|nr:TolC family protein [Acidobacteriota bacterium]